MKYKAVYDVLNERRQTTPGFCYHAVSYTHLDVYKRQALEGIGYNILSMPRQQWNRINQMAA